MPRQGERERATAHAVAVEEPCLIKSVDTGVPHTRAQLTGPFTHTRDRLRRVEFIPKRGKPEGQGSTATRPRITTDRQVPHVSSDIDARSAAMAAIGHACPFCTAWLVSSTAPPASASVPILAAVVVISAAIPSATPLWASGLPALSP